ncbi:hypothetical protein GO986_17380 [Deinococcus sp. HMF7620]|uniref:Uncharacterized protein n=1 Tax=Deinococcus arboris TaxID=2682977 RepID=A0A7C9I1B8_9DEIO|nr:hypothetical protein [Deinococcus arboris]MVN88515.1 hypothetical protein [Deinococcus arboris]
MSLPLAYVPPLTRAHLRFLNVLPLAQASDVTDLQQLELSPSAQRTLRRFLTVPGIRTGLLFGTRQGDLLRVHAVTLGSPDTIAPFALQPAYVLGLADAFGHLDATLDWVGHWITVPEDQCPDQAARLAWFKRAEALHLVTRDCPLLLAGWVEGQLQLCALRAGDTRGDNCELVVLESR